MYFHTVISQFWLLVVLVENESVIKTTEGFEHDLNSIISWDLKQDYNYGMSKIKIWWEATHFFSESLFQQSASGSSQSVNTTEDDYEVVGTVNDRSTLSDEMAAMCAKFPIYRIKRRKVTMSVEKENIQGICVLLCRVLFNRL